MTLRPVWIVAFSGNRPSSDIDQSPVGLQTLRERIRLLLLEFRTKARVLEGDIELLSSVADGADQIAIDVAESLGISVHIILPLPISEFAKDFRGRPHAWDMSLASIAKAGGLKDRDGQVVASLCECGERKNRTAEWPPAPIVGWTFRISDGTHEHADCYFDCGTQMLDAADALIVVGNRGSDGGCGKTRDVIYQAKARGIGIAVVDSTDQQPVSIEWTSGPWVTDPIVAEMESASSVSRQPPFSSKPIESVFATLDQIATRTGSQLKNRVTTIIGLQFTATILAAINSALVLPNLPSDYQGNELKWDAVLIVYQILFGCELLLVVLALFLGYSSRWSNLKSTWRQTRFGAEILRSLMHTRGLVDPLYPIVSRHNPIWHRFALCSALSTLRDDDRKAVDWEAVKAKYHRHRMEHQREVYYRKQLVGASKLSVVCGTLSTWAGTLAPICLIAAMYLKFAHKTWITASVWSPVLVKLLPILLPLLAGSAASLKVVTDAGRRAERYRTQANRLQVLSNWFPTLKTPSSIRRAVVLAEEVLLDELIEWHAASKSTGK